MPDTLPGPSRRGIFDVPSQVSDLGTPYSPPISAFWGSGKAPRCRAVRLPGAEGRWQAPQCGGGSLKHGEPRGLEEEPAGSHQDKEACVAGG